MSQFSGSGGHGDRGSVTSGPTAKRTKDIKHYLDALNVDAIYREIDPTHAARQLVRAPAVGRGARVAEARRASRVDQEATLGQIDEHVPGEVRESVRVLHVGSKNPAKTRATRVQALHLRAAQSPSALQAACGPYASLDSNSSSGPAEVAVVTRGGYPIPCRP